jgi:hypothetical protein
MAAPSECSINSCWMNWILIWGISRDFRRRVGVETKKGNKHGGLKPSNTVIENGRFM